MPRILILVAHPQMAQSRVSRALVAAARSLAVSADQPGATAVEATAVEVRDLYALYPDYHLDTDAERAALTAADLLVWLHPWHWYGMPPMLKLWLDEVLAFGWAYGPGGQALAGKDLWLVTSTGGSAESYQPEGHNRHRFDDFLPPYRQTAALCGLQFLTPCVVHGAHHLADSEMAALAQQFAEQLASYPAWARQTPAATAAPCLVPAEARPQDAVPDGPPHRGVPRPVATR